MSGAINFISYLRVSTHQQGATGLGIEAQREAVGRYVAAAGGKLLEEHVEVETGSSSRRPILLRSITRCRAEKAVLLIARLDRLARSVSFIASLMDGGIEFIAVDMPAANKMMLQMLAVFAEFERDQIAARTKAALAAAKARGVILGSNGKMLAAKRIAEADGFAETLRTSVEEALAAGVDTLVGVARSLNERKIQTREGASWSASTAYRLMMRLALQTPQMTLRTKVRPLLGERS